MTNTSPLQLATGLPADAAAPVTTECGDFAAVLASACVDEPDTKLPEGMESAAALAWLAGMVVVPRPAEVAPPAGDAAADGASETVAAAGIGAGDQLAGSVAGNILASRTSGITVAAAPTAATGVSSAAGAASPAIQKDIPVEGLADLVGASVEDSTDTPSVAPGDAPDVPSPLLNVAAKEVSRNTDGADEVAARAPMPLTLMRVLAAAHARPETPAVPAAAVAAATSGANTAASTAIATAAAAADPAVEDDKIQFNAPLESSSAGERVISAVSDSSATPAVTADFDQQSNSGSNLYANTRESVVGTSTPVGGKPEVVPSPVGSPRWASEIGSRLMTMSLRGQQEGSLTLTPEHLGPLEVRISVNQDTTNVWFGAQHADTRAALTEALPRLREMFSASGLALGQAGVSHEMPRQDTRRGEFRAATGQGSGTEAVTAAPAPAVARHVRSVLLDTWA